jgi:hypothetical protein
MNLLNTKIQTNRSVSRTETFIFLDQQIDRQIHFKKQLRQYKNKSLKKAISFIKRDASIHVGNYQFSNCLISSAAASL